VTDSICSVPGCGCRHYQRGFCTKHFARWKRHGDPAITLRPWLNWSPEETFRHWMPDDPPISGCWPWRGRVGAHGYGLIGSRDRHLRANRVAFELFNGPIGTGLVIRHTCDNPVCVNPAHLLAGTDAENSQDMVDRGRQQRGSRHRQTHLSEEDVRQIRIWHSAGDRTKKELAGMFGISRSAVGLIVNRKTWKHVV
jgi:hypothetical protein